MKKRLLGIILCAVCTLAAVSVAAAHPGGTDAWGGHTDHSTGKYHYHHGYPAHQHINGVCPYDFDDKTGQNSGSSGSSYSSSTLSTEYKKGYDKGYDDGYDDGKEANSCSFHIPTTIFVLVSLVLAIVTVVARHSRKERKALRSEVETLERRNSTLSADVHRSNEENAQLSQTVELLRRRGEFVEKRLNRFVLDRLGVVTDIPPGVVLLPDLLPAMGELSEETPYGVYTVYMAPNGNRYHTEFGCHGAIIPIHIFQATRLYRPCQQCLYKRYVDSKIPEWYVPIMDRIMDIRSKRGIT